MPNDIVKKSTPVMRAPTKMERFRDMATDFLDAVAAQPLAKVTDTLGLTGIGQQARDAVDPEAAYRMKLGIMPGGPGRGVFGSQAEGAFARQMKGAPAEFQQIQPNRYTVDPNEMPSGKMEYLDPDVAAYMNPSPLDVTTRAGQDRLKLMLGRR